MRLTIVPVLQMPSQCLNSAIHHMSYFQRMRMVIVAIQSQTLNPYHNGRLIRLYQPLLLFVMITALLKTTSTFVVVHVRYAHSFKGDAAVHCPVSSRSIIEYVMCEPLWRNTEMGSLGNPWKLAYRQSAIQVISIQWANGRNYVTWRIVRLPNRWLPAWWSKASNWISVLVRTTSVSNRKQFTSKLAYLLTSFYQNLPVYSPGSQ